MIVLTEQELLMKINSREKMLVNLKDKSDTEIQGLTKELQKDYQQAIFLEAKAETHEERRKYRQIRNRIIDQQNLISKYQQLRYRSLIKRSAPKPPVLKNTIAAFLVGGTITSLGQILLNFYIWQGLTFKEASTATSITVVFLGALLTGLGVYDEIGKVGGAGSMVPISGFANSIVSPALEFKREGYVYGVGAKIFTIAGPVILYGTLTSVIIGLITYITM